MSQHTKERRKPTRINWIHIHSRRAAAIELDRLLGTPSRPDVRRAYDLRTVA